MTIMFVDQLSDFFTCGVGCTCDFLRFLRLRKTQRTPRLCGCHRIARISSGITTRQAIVSFSMPESGSEADEDVEFPVV